MAIYDCFQYFNEEHIAELRFNILNKFVDKFIVVESTVNHQGQSKKLNFDINKYKKFKNKINYIIVDDTPNDIKQPHEGGESLVEQYQRNSIMKGLKDANDNDLIILSDVDEIPNLHRLNEFDKSKYAVFSQKMFMYKLNFLNLKENNWHGSKICLKKNFRSPQWLRDLKFKKRSFWRLDKFRLNNIITDGGWHFCNLKSPENLLYKYKNLCETNDPYTFKEKIDEKFLKLDEIKKKVDNGSDIIGRNETFRPIILDKRFPNYILKNRQQFEDWIVDYSNFLK